MTDRSNQELTVADRDRQVGQERHTEPDRQTGRQTNIKIKKIACLKKYSMPRWGPNFLVLILLQTGERSELRFFLFEALCYAEHTA